MVSFYSNAPFEDIEAVNSKVTSIFDASNGEIVFSVPISDFKFKKSLMKQHFNENYMESEKYPTSTFKGVVTGFNQIEGTYSVKSTGMLTMHGVTQNIQVTGQLEITPEAILVEAEFPVLLKDFDIKIPRILISNIAESVDVTLDIKYDPYVEN